jgi:trk system potassium uptake protein TrkA
MYIVIVGAGDIGTPLIEVATDSGNEVVVIERDEARAEAVATDYDCLVLNDDATLKDTLRDAGTDRADALISTTEQDAINIMVCLLAQELDVPSVVSVVNDPEHRNVFRQIGVSGMENPQRLIAEHLYRAVNRPSVVDFMRIGEQAEVFEVTVDEQSPIAGRTIAAADDDGLLPAETLIVAVERDDEAPITPRGDTLIKADDLLVVYSGEGATPELTDTFGHREDHHDELGDGEQR